LSPSDKARKEDDAYVRDKLREIIGNEAGWIYSIMINNKVLCLGNVLSDEIPTNGQVPMAIFDEKGVYIKGLKNYKIKNWPFDDVLPLKSYTSSQIRLLKSCLPKIYLEKLDLQYPVQDKNPSRKWIRTWRRNLKIRYKINFFF
jgi:hypothetical protein